MKQLRCSQIMTLTRKELRATFFSPIAYLVLVVFLVVSGTFFWTTFFASNQAELRSYFNTLPWILTFILPALTMKVFAEEKQTGSYELLATLPFTLPEIILGKFLGVLLFASLFVLTIFFYGFSVELVGALDWGTVVSGALGAFFLIAFYLAIGVFCSSLARNQIVAFLLGVVMSLFFFLIDKFFIFLPEALVKLLNFFSSDLHFKNFTRGVVDSRDLFFFLVLMFLFLAGTYKALEKQFLQQR